MNNENKSIHEFDFNLICDYFSGMERQGPGSPEVTLKALSFIDNLTDTSRIADLGCGTGGQTMTLASNTKGFITGIDLFPAFIDRFNHNAGLLGLQDRVTGVIGSMDNLPFGDEELDLIWCEGAIYNIGFERGLKEWHRFLNRGGYIAVSEASWFTPYRPSVISEFWNEAYPEIDTVPAKLTILQNSGYIPVAAFILPESCWTDNFYALQADLQIHFLEKYPGNKTAEELVANQRHEAMLYDKYRKFYGYAFYIGKKL